MKKAIGVTISVVVVTTLALAILPTTRDEIHWRWESHKGQTASFESYVKSWPTGRHAAESKLRYDEHGWVDTQATNTVHGYEQYVQLHADGKHVLEAKESIESIHWRDATATNTVHGYEQYVQLHADGKHVLEAKESIEPLELKLALTENSPSLLRDFLNKYPDSNLVETALRKLNSLEDGAWKACIQSNTIDLYKNYASQYPDGRHVKDARAHIQIPEFNSAYGISVKFTEEQMRTYIEMLNNEACSTVINKPLEYYEIEGDRDRGSGVTNKRKVVVEPSSDQKACSLQLEAGNLSITAIYISAPSGSSILRPLRPLFPEKWKPTMAHTGSAGPGLEIELFPDQRISFKKFLDTFSIVYRDIFSAETGSIVGYVIADLVSGSDQNPRPYPHVGHEFKIKDGYLFKVDGVKGMPNSVIATYEQALALKTYLNMIKTVSSEKSPFSR